jgi:hypothetical protein
MPGGSARAPALASRRGGSWRPAPDPTLQNRLVARAMLAAHASSQIEHSSISYDIWHVPAPMALAPHILLPGSRRAFSQGLLLDAALGSWVPGSRRAYPQGLLPLHPAGAGTGVPPQTPPCKRGWWLVHCWRHMPALKLSRAPSRTRTGMRPHRWHELPTSLAGPGPPGPGRGCWGGGPPQPRVTQRVSGAQPQKSYQAGRAAPQASTAGARRVHQ